MAKSSFTFDLRGIKDVRKRIGTITEKMDTGLNNLVEAAAYDMNDDAISNIQSEGAQDLGAGGGLLSHQYVQAAGKRSWEVGNSAFYAPFIEWGTGRQVKVPTEWREMAMQYKGPYPGTWDLFEQNIKAWMKRHGIPERKVVTHADGTESYIDVAYYIMVSILENGLKPRPFLYPAYVKNKTELVKQVKQLFAKK